MDIYEILDYEVKSSWWAQYISNNFLQKLSSKFFAAKTKRKFKRYLFVKEIEQKINKQRG